MSNSKIFLIAGEASGDLHAANLIRALKAKDSSLHFTGLGGPQMRSAGCELLADIMDFSIVGIIEVLTNYRKLKRLFNTTLNSIIQQKPAAVILIDYPGFNLRMAEKLKAHNIKVIYYVSPQVWAWHKSRVSKMKRFIDKLIVIFPFELDFFLKEGVSNVTFLGHPLLDIKDFQDPPARHAISQPPKIGLLPGSRLSEIKHNLPIMLNTAQLLPSDTDLVLSIANDNCEREVDRILAGYPNLSITKTRDTYHLMRSGDFLLIASGTATLEAACLQVPMAIIYKVSWITYWLARLVVKIKYLGIVNIIDDQYTVPEFIQFDAKPNRIAAFVTKLLHDPGQYDEMVQRLQHVREKLGTAGASERVASEVLSLIP